MGSIPSAPQLKDTEVGKGNNITLHWESDVGAYSKWKKEEKTLENGGRINITQSKDYKHFNLTVKDAREEDEGQYTLELWNRKGLASGSAKVKILEYDVDWRKIDWRPQENERVKKSLGELKLSNPEIKHLSFLLHRPVGAGKSSIVNSINCTLQGRLKVKALVASCFTTSFTKDSLISKVKDHKGTELPSVFIDIMGLENPEKDGLLIDDIISILKGHVSKGYNFNPRSALTEGNHYYNKNPTLDDKVHCLVSVIPADKIALLDDTNGIIKKMVTVRKAASVLGIPQVVFMTHVDCCCPLVKKDLKRIYSSKTIKLEMQHCSNKLGVPMNCIFPVKNYHEENKVDENMDSLILDALYNVVDFANDCGR